MKSVRPTRIGLALLLATIGTAAGASAQTNDEIFPQFQWNFSTPGARANGMGRTFIGMADDATATVTNPAGLVSLTKPQIYVEYKNTNIKVDRLAAVDSWLPGRQNPTTFSTGVNALSFFSASTPIGDKLAVGFTVHQFLNYQETFHLTARGIPDINNPNNIVSQVINNVPNGFAANPVDGSANFKGTSFAGTVAYSVNDQVRVGLTVSENHLSANATGTRFGIQFLPGWFSNQTAVGESNIIKNQTTIDDSSNAMGVAVGLLYRANENFSVGFDFTKSPHFNVSENFLFNPNFNSAVCCGTNLPPGQALTAFTGFPEQISINVPNHFGFGVAGRPTPKLLLGFDVVRVNYSSLTDDFKLVIDFSNTRDNGGNLSTSQFTINNVTEVHFGGEYTLISGMNPIFVRAGVYTNPNHTIMFTPGTTGNATLNVDNSFYNAVYNLLPRDTKVSGTFGAGVAVGPRFQVDTAFVFNNGKSRPEFVASTAVRF